MPFSDYFFDVIDDLSADLHANEVLLASFTGETSDFVRLNQDRVRQAGTVQQLELSLDLIEGRRHAVAQCQMSSDKNLDLTQLRKLIARLRQQRMLLSDDPYLSYNTTPENSEHRRTKPLPASHDALRTIVAAADGLDLVGFYASGFMNRGFANSLGQKNWYCTTNFNFDWTCYHHNDKGVKSRYAGFEWSAARLEQKLEGVRETLNVMKQTPVTLKPGEYRAYLAPNAVNEMLSTLSWGAFGLKSHRTRQTPLIKLVRNARCLNENIRLRENNGQGFAARFTRQGFIKPEQVTLIDGGRYADCLVDARSGGEYRVPINASSEYPESLDLSAGELESSETLKALDTGIYINNLWYSNFSDRNDCRITGLTRYACFWVEKGRIKAPINVMRFDDSLYRMLGDNLLGLSRERELILDTETYERRSAASMHLPGLLIDRLTLTL